MARGRERQVICAKCGRNVRRDKAVFIEKAVFSNPIERKDTADDQYTRAFFRELAYCPSCGKHLRIYEKKMEQNQRQREREQERQFSGHQHHGQGHNRGQHFNARTGSYREPTQNQQQ